MNDAAGDAAGRAPRAIIGDLPEPVWPELLGLVRTALERTTHEPRRLSPFVGWHPDKFDRPEVRRAVAQVLAADARFRADLRDVLTDHDPDLAARAERGELHPSGGEAPGAVAAALVAWDRWEALATFGARVADEQVRRSTSVAAERPGDLSSHAGKGRTSQPDATAASAPTDVTLLEGRIRELERALQHRDRRLAAVRGDLERVRREREAAVARRNDVERELQDLKTRQRDRLTRLRRRYHDARDRAAAAEARVAGLAEELTRLLGRLTGQHDESSGADKGQVANVTLDGPGDGEAASSSARHAGAAAVPRGVRPAEPGRPCQLPPGIAAGTPEAAMSLLQVDQLELLIDGYNVSKDLRGRPSASLPDQRLWLLRTVAGASAWLPVRPTIVFDAAEAVTGPSPSARGVRVVFTDPGELADDRIAAYVAAMGDDVPVCVVTSDRQVRDRCAAQAANTVASGDFLRAIGASS